MGREGGEGEGRPERGRVGRRIDGGTNGEETGTDAEAWKTTERKEEGRAHRYLETRKNCEICVCLVCFKRKEIEDGLKE